ncbi:MAG: fibronectin type III domain-containing protein [Verrucomicrobia bacterium]|nr:fibronectin type III domain-containing protein [Verrucomicrobiota bacterium]
MGKLSVEPQTSVNRDGSWQAGHEGTKNSFTIGGLTPGQMYYFHMAAFGPDGWEPSERHRPAQSGVAEHKHARELERKLRLFCRDESRL